MAFLDEDVEQITVDEVLARTDRGLQCLIETGEEVHILFKWIKEDLDSDITPNAIEGDAGVVVVPTWAAQKMNLV